MTKDFLIDLAFGIVNLFLATGAFMIAFSQLHEIMPVVPAAGYWDVFSITVWFGIGIMFIKHWLFTNLSGR